MIHAIMIAVSALVVGVSLYAGEPTRSGMTTQVMSNAGQIAESRIAFEYYPNSESLLEYQKTINKLISVGVQFHSPDESVPAETEKLDDQFFSNPLVNLAKRFGLYMNSMPNSNEAPWSIIDSTKVISPVLIQGQGTGIVQLVRSRYEFTGGAHGSTTIAVWLVSRGTGKLLSFENDIVRNIKAFRKIAEQHFRKARKIKARQSLRSAGYWFEKGFALSQNVLLSDETITLIYNPYECAPYVMGEIRVTIPMNEVKKFIRIPVE